MIALLVLLAVAQEPAPGIVLNADWALGQAVPGDWQSVLVELQNPGPRELALRIEAEEEISSTRVFRDESVPAGGRRRVHLTLPLGGPGRHLPSMQVRIRAVDGAGKELGVRTLANPYAWSPSSVVVAILTRDRAAEGAFRVPRRRGQTEIGVVFPAPRTFPDHWTALDGVAALLLHDAPLSELSPDQAKAILDYARRGGTLLLSPGVQRDGFAHPVIAALAEIRTGEPERRRSLAGYGNAPEGFLHHSIRGGRPWELEGPDGPSPRRILVEGCRIFDCGFGRVIALPFDVAAPPVAGSQGLENLWHLALEMRDGRPDEGLDGAEAASALAGLVNPYPSFLLLAGLSALYLAAVGPVNYLLLRRLRMTLLLVVSIPLVSAAFLGLVLALGYLLKGSSTLVCSVRLLDTVPGAPFALETQVATVFSPESRAYRIAFPRDRAALPLDRAHPGHRDVPPLRVEDVPLRTFDGVAVGQWQTWRALVRSHAELGGGLRFEIRDGVLVVENASPLPVARGLHVRRVGDAVVGTPFGPLKPSDRLTAELAVSRWMPEADLGFGPEGVGAALLGRASLHAGLIAPAEGEEILICVLADDAPLLEVDGRAPGRERSLALLTARKGGAR